MSIDVTVVTTSKIQVPGLGDRIKQARHLKMCAGTTTAELAAAAGMSTQNWYQIEGGKQGVKLEVLRKMEVALGVDLGVDL
jgi:transcriptional regulator with XRE-family HTH domain